MFKCHEIINQNSQMHNIIMNLAVLIEDYLNVVTCMMILIFKTLVVSIRNYSLINEKSVLPKNSITSKLK